MGGLKYAGLDCRCGPFLEDGALVKLDDAVRQFDGESSVSVRVGQLFLHNLLIGFRSIVIRLAIVRCLSTYIHSMERLKKVPNVSSSGTQSSS